MRRHDARCANLLQPACDGRGAYGVPLRQLQLGLLAKNVVVNERFFKNDFSIVKLPTAIFAQVALLVVFTTIFYDRKRGAVKAFFLPLLFLSANI